MKYILKISNLIFLLIITTVIGTAAPKPSTRAVTDTASQNFVSMAATGGMMEVDAGKLAVKNAGAPGVRTFGAKMVTDHSKANAELKTIAMAKGYKLPAKAPQEHINMMVGKRGMEFDKHYISMMMKDHDKTIALFEKAAAGLADADLRAFAVRHCRR